MAPQEEPLFLTSISAGVSWSTVQLWCCAPVARVDGERTSRDKERAAKAVDGMVFLCLGLVFNAEGLREAEFRQTWT